MSTALARREEEDKTPAERWREQQRKWEEEVAYHVRSLRSAINNLVRSLDERKGRYISERVREELLGYVRDVEHHARMLLRLLPFDEENPRDEALRALLRDIVMASEDLESMLKTEKYVRRELRSIADFISHREFYVLQYITELPYFFFITRKDLGLG